jgi:hypothetical protein
LTKQKSRLKPVFTIKSKSRKYNKLKKQINQRKNRQGNKLTDPLPAHTKKTCNCLRALNSRSRSNLTLSGVGLYTRGSIEQSSMKTRCLLARVILMKPWKTYQSKTASDNSTNQRICPKLMLGTVTSVFHTSKP